MEEEEEEGEKEREHDCVLIADYGQRGRGREGRAHEVLRCGRFRRRS